MTCCGSTIGSQDVTDSGVRDLVAEIGQSALDPVVAPGRISTGYGENKFDDLSG